MAFGIEFVDNQEFLDFFTVPNHDHNPFVRQLFFSADGATLIMTQDRLNEVLDELFFERVDLGLEELFVPDTPPETTTCSIPTFNAS